MVKVIVDWLTNLRFISGIPKVDIRNLFGRDCEKSPGKNGTRNSTIWGFRSSETYDSLSIKVLTYLSVKLQFNSYIIAKVIV